MTNFINNEFLSKILLLIFSNFLIILCLPPLNWSFVVWFAFVPMFLAYRENSYLQQALLGLLAGLFYFGYLFYWILVFGKLAFFSLIIFQALFWSLFAVVYKVFHNRLDNWQLLLVVPLLWTTIEILKSSGPLSLSWGLIGYNLLPFLTIIQTASLFGVLGLSFIVITVNYYLYTLLITKGYLKKGERIFGLTFASFIVILLIFGFFRLSNFNSTNSLKTINLGLVQPSVPMDLKVYPPSRQMLEKRMMLLSKEAVEKDAEIIIWPESAFPGLYFTEDVYFEDLIDELDGVPLIFGALVYENGITYNSAFYLNKEGIIEERYDKLHPVPFGEYIPLRPILQKIKALSAIQDDLTAGKNMVLLGQDEHKMGTLICFESAEIFLTRRMSALKPDALIIITNDAWYGQTTAPEQHFRIGMMRAVENGLPLVQVANSGITGTVKPTGEYKESGKIFTQFARIEKLELNGRVTLYRLTGHYQAVLIVLLTILALLKAIFFSITKNSDKKT